MSEEIRHYKEVSPQQRVAEQFQRVLSLIDLKDVKRFMRLAPAMVMLLGTLVAFNPDSNRAAAAEVGDIGPKIEIVNKGGVQGRFIEDIFHWSSEPVHSNYNMSSEQRAELTAQLALKKAERTVNSSVNTENLVIEPAEKQDLVDVLYLYDDDTGTALGGVEGVQAYTRTYLDVISNNLVRSGTDNEGDHQGVRDILYSEVDYDTSNVGFINEIYTDLAAHGQNGKLEEVQALAEMAGADMVVMLVRFDDDHGCGTGTFGLEGGVEMAVINTIPDCDPSGKKIIPHEYGHNLEKAHDIGQWIGYPPPPEPDAYGAGIPEIGTDIMSYLTVACYEAGPNACPEVAQYSDTTNPLENGGLLGIPGQANIIRTLSQSNSEVASVTEESPLAGEYIQLDNVEDNDDDNLVTFTGTFYPFNSEVSYRVNGEEWLQAEVTGYTWSIPDVAFENDSLEIDINGNLYVIHKKYTVSLPLIANGTGQ